MHIHRQPLHAGHHVGQVLLRRPGYFLVFFQRHSGKSSRDVHVAIAQQSFRHQAGRRVRQNIRLESLVEPHHDFNIAALLGNMSRRARDKLDRFNVSDIDAVQPHRRSI